MAGYCFFHGLGLVVFRGLLNSIYSFDLAACWRMRMLAAAFLGILKHSSGAGES